MAARAALRGGTALRGWRPLAAHVGSSRLASIQLFQRAQQLAIIRALAQNTTKLEGTPLSEIVGPGLQLMLQEFMVAEQVLRSISPIDVDAVMDMYIEAGTDGDPYWTRVWPSAIALSQQLLERPELVAGKKVADLGAGLGVAGIAAALAGAREVVLLDREPLALECALRSALASGVTRVGQLEGCSSTSSSTGTLGGSSRGGSGQPGQAASSRPGEPALLRAQVFDWASMQQPEQFDVVLACDVLYEDSAVEPIAGVVPRLLHRDRGVLLLADPPNRTAQNRARFLQQLAETSRPAPLQLQECWQFECQVSKLDPEMIGGVTSETVPVQFMALARVYGGDTVGLKL